MVSKRRLQMNYLILFVFCGALWWGSLYADNETELVFSPQDTTIKLGESVGVTGRLTFALNESIKVSLGTLHDKENSSKIEPPFFVIKPAAKSAQFEVKSLKVDSELTIEAVDCHLVDKTPTNESKNCSIGLLNAFIRVKIVHNLALETVNKVVGWIYFVAWSVSFYPQIWLNWKRKSVVGLNFDFLALNFVGFTCYSLFNCALRYNPVVRAEYIADKGPRARIPVDLNDVFFSLHAILATLLTIGQCFIYPRAGQRVSYTCWAFLSTAGAFFGVTLILTLAKVSIWLNWLQFFKFVSYIKIAITLIKYVPQAYFNYRRKSTVGWSIGNILLDFTGGSFSILQMTLESYNVGDYSEYFGDVTKFLLGLISICFDILFMLQHYVLYRTRREYKDLEAETPAVDDEHPHIRTD